MKKKYLIVDYHMLDKVLDKITEIKGNNLITIRF